MSDAQPALTPTSCPNDTPLSLRLEDALPAPRAEDVLLTPHCEDVPLDPHLEDDILDPTAVKGPPALALVTDVKGKPPRHRKGDPKSRPGKKSWVWGTKRIFFEKRKEEWLREAEAKRSGLFYTKIGKLFIKKYGYHLRDDQDLAVDVADPPDSAANEVVHEILTEEEKSFRADYLQTLRGRIGGWYRAEYGNLLKTDQESFKELFTGVLDGAPPKPQRGRLVHFYSRKYYNTRIKDRVESLLASLKRRTEHSGEKMPHIINIISKVTTKVWEEETPVFQHECEMVFECEHQQTLNAWEASLADSPTRTPDEIAATLENAAFYLQPWTYWNTWGTNWSAKCACWNDEGLAPVNWPTFDWRGFQEVEKFMIGFARECFSEAECKARAVAGTENAETSTPTSPASLGTTSPTSTPEGPLTSGPRAPSASTPGVLSASTPGAPSVSTLEAPSTSTPEAPSASTTEALSMSTPEAQAVDVQMGMEEREECGATPQENSTTAKENDGGERGHIGSYDKRWQCDDCAVWTTELGKAHTAFERGRTWGMEWATCVQKFFDFEGAWGFVDGTTQMPKGQRPQEVTGWISRGRKWGLPPALGGLLGRCHYKDQGEDLWVGRWWVWWWMLQPEERAELDNGGLSCPETANWSKMARLYGKNGLLQVMATLVWWGEVVKKRGGEEDREEWVTAVCDVMWVLGELLKLGEIRRDARDENEDQDGDEDPDPEAAAPAEQTGKRKRGGPGRKKKNTSEGAEPPLAGDTPPPRKKRRVKEATEVEALRRANRLRGAAPDGVDEGRRTRSSGVSRPKPKPVYKGRA
ncbi:hypothetical protein DFH08DRAFT_974219 [Mycena albidolilacea]|uniref:Uncharacterized protein n=1 Tax=Mycena albidolilacea TaxID=1033008 RepID=A0AAD6Z791_9AGAR|nr:hypothetical protein DFH08DRAFT_974219 [Mycena albidolilacea]